VGSGPFPTELTDATGDFLRNAGNEFGSTTGRPRRCGWIDLVALRFACMINGVSQIVMTKADILDGLEALKACTSYNINGETQQTVPFQMHRMNIEAIYESCAGWNTDISTVSNYEAMPDKMKSYISFINNYLGVPVKYISNGPGRDQIVSV
jgi:adenylosuccinate synthase